MSGFNYRLYHFCDLALERGDRLDGFELYEDIQRDIQYYKEWMRQVEKEWKNIRRMAMSKPSFHGVVDTSADDVMGGLTRLPLDRAWEREKVLVKRHRDLEHQLKEAERLAKDVSEDLKMYSGTSRRIRYKKIVEGKTLKEIASEMGYSYDWVRELHAREKNPQTPHRHVDRRVIG